MVKQVRRWVGRPSWCPDKQCRPMAVLAVYNPDETGCCMGQLARPTDHVLTGVNDMCMCYKQKKVDRWHYNFNDAMAIILMLVKVLEARQQPLPAWLLYRLSHIKPPHTLP